MTNDKSRVERKHIPFAMVPLVDIDDAKQITKDENKTSQQGGAPVCEAILYLLGRLLAGGLLALPYVILKGGIASIASMIIIPAICYYTGQILIDCLYEKTYNGVPFRVRSSYQEIGNACWDRYGGIITVGLQTTQLFLLSAACLVLSASLVSYMLRDLGFGDRTWIAIAGLVSLPLILAKDLSQVMWLSLLSLTSLLAAAVVITGYGYSKGAPWKISELEQLKEIPLALSIITYSNVAHGTLPTVEEHMEKRSKFNKMLAITYLFSTTLRVLFAVNAFFSFYRNIHEIISNSLPLNSPIHLTVNGLLVAYSLLCYPFLGITIIHIMESSLSETLKEKLPDVAWYVGSRMVLSLVTIATALAIPHFALLLAISGNLAACIALVLPTIFHLRLKFKELSMWRIILNSFVLLIGIGISVVGTIFAVRELIRVYFS